MDENVERAEPDTVGEGLGQDVVRSAERLAARVAVLREQVRALVPHDQGRLPQPGSRTDELRDLLTRVRALEERFEELEDMTEGATVSGSERRAVERRTIDPDCRLAFVEGELRARLAELSGLRSRCGWFDDDLEVLAEEAAVVAGGAARATRLAKERGEARVRGSSEPRLANVTELNRRIEAVRESARFLEPVGTPWVELQHLASAIPDSPAENDSAETSEA